MTIAEIFLTETDVIALWVVIFLSLIQIAPIKINPWSWIARKLGKALTGDLESELHNLRDDFDLSQVTQARIRILRFNDELLRDEPHSKEFFDNVLEDVDVYERYCIAHPQYRNSKAVLAIANIRRCYEKHEADRDFLK